MKTNLAILVPSNSASRTSKRHAAAFTLVELLTVIAIIVLLVGLTISVLGFAQKKALEKKASGQMEVIITGLTTYNLEFGGYPEPEDNSGEGSGGAKALYQALSGDGDDHLRVASSEGSGSSIGEVGSTTDQVIIEGIDPEANKFGLVAADFALTDPFSQYWKYRKHLKDETGDPTRNKTYDLWSNGIDGKKDNEAKWIKNW